MDLFSDPNSLVALLLRWAHIVFGIIWIGHLYFFNLVNVPAQADIPAEMKPKVNPAFLLRALYWFRWGAMFTVITGLIIAFNKGFAIPALTFQGGDGNVMIGLGMWIAIIMFLNVWLVIWPNQKKILGLVEATDEQKAKATPIAGIASRLNTLLSLPMFYCMVNANLT